MAKKVFPRLHEIAPAARGGITQPRANLVGHLCTYQIKDAMTLRQAASGSELTYKCCAPQTTGVLGKCVLDVNVYPSFIRSCC